MKRLLFVLIFFCSLPVYANEFSDNFSNPHNWMVRGRVIAVDPVESSSAVTVIGGHVNRISRQIVPELDINYFFNKYVSTELILATSRHSIDATGTSLGKVDVGRVNVLPPTLTVKLHAFPDDSWTPYIGAGVNYTHFYNEKKGRLLTAIDFDDSFGAAFQAGLDIKADEHWSFNIDVKKVYIHSDVHFTALDTKMKTHARIDPLIFGVGVGYRF